ncbi:Interleukin-11 [Sciurus carolinensis]|uniref:Interleukin-11 n=1 Tax=Sciurus carolinensis TaxID=30640 RepID=A0AA41SSB5_SCICA|nr:Interleukin-11 [Sciurus carolinensis]
MPRPGAQIPASGGGRETPGPSTRPGPRLLRRAGQPESGREREARLGPANCPWALHPEPPISSVCHLVLVVLSLRLDRVVAPGPPPGPPRVPPDPRADLDSAVLLTRSLLADTRQLAAQLRDKFPAEGDHNLDSLPTLAMSAGALGALQRDKFPAEGDHNLDSLPTLAMSAGALGALQWLRRAGGPSLKTLEPELGALQARLDRLLRRLQLLMSRLALPQTAPDPPAPPLAPPASAWGGIRAAHAILGGLHLTLDWAVRGLLLLKTRL